MKVKYGEEANRKGEKGFCVWGRRMPALCIPHLGKSWTGHDLHHQPTQPQLGTGVWDGI